MSMICETYFNPKTKIWSGPHEEFKKFPSLGDVLLKSLQNQPNKIIQIFHDNGEQLTCGDIYARSIKLAKKLQKKGMRPGDVVTVITNTHPDVIPLIVALYAVGAIVNPFMPADITVQYDNKSLLKLLNPKFVITEVIYLDAVQEHVNHIDQSIVIIPFDGLHSSIEEMLHAEDDSTEYIAPAEIISDKTISVILASSGTTGTPKAICLSHSMIVGRLFRVDQTKTSTNSIIFNFSPLDWISGFMTAMSSLIHNKTRVITKQAISPKTIVDIITKYSVSETMMSPSITKLVMQYLTDKNKVLPTLRVLYLGGEYVSATLRTSIETFLPNGKVIIVYASTEMATMTVATSDNNGNSVGFLCQGYQMKIVGEGNAPLGHTDIGEIHVKSTYDFLGYYNCKEATLKAIDYDGWFRSGDMGYFDNEGDLYITGRKNNIFHSSNYAINPHDIETVLLGHKGVSEAHVAGIEDVVAYALPTALIVRAKNTKVSVNDLNYWIAVKLPKSHELRGRIYFVDSLPRNSRGKVKRKVADEIAFNLYHKGQ